MQEVGLAATELGPDGFLPADPAAMAEFLAAHHLTAVGGFTPVLMHRPDHDPLRRSTALLDRLRRRPRRGPGAVRRHRPGRLRHPARPGRRGWTHAARNLDRIAARAAEHGVRAVLHPHVGTMVETGDEVQRVLEGSAISLCLDTGHLLIGGTDPAELTRQAPDRIAHTHFKDVDQTVAAQVRSGRLTYTEAVTRGHVPAAGHR